MVLVFSLSFLEQVMHINGLIGNIKSIVSVCNSMVLYFVALQIASRTVSFFVRNDGETVRNMYDLILKFYEREQKTIAYRPLLLRKLENTEVFMKSYVALTTFGFCTPIITTLILSSIRREFFLFAPLYMPFTDPTQLFGFTVNVILLFVVTMLCSAIIMAGDAYIILGAFQIMPMADIFELKLHDFGMKLKEAPVVEDLDHQPSTSRGTAAWVTAFAVIQKKKNREKQEKQLIELIKEFHDYNDYIGLVFKYAELTFFMALLCNSIGIGLAVIVMRFFSIPIGMTYFFLLSMQVAMPCMIGTMVSTQNEKLLDAVCSFPWYELSVKNQKVFLQFLLECQNANQFDLQMIGSLDMELFTSVMNGAYSYLMYILNFM
jgi:hypothetical protein